MNYAINANPFKLVHSAKLPLPTTVRGKIFHVSSIGFKVGFEGQWYASIILRSKIKKQWMSHPILLSMRAAFMDRHIFIVYKKTPVNVGAPMTKLAATSMLILEN